MSKNNDQIYGFDYPDLESSDQQQQNKPKNNQPTGDPVKKTKIDPSIQKNNQVQTKPSSNTLSNNSNQKNVPKPVMPFFPPPPPGSQVKSSNQWVPPPPTPPTHNQHYNKSHHSNYQKSYGQNNKNYDANRDKKTIIYVKNIPKSYSTQQKLMTFFKNEGVIKQIKVNDVEQSAVIKFLKQQNAAKFLKSNKIIFNRSYIVYGDRQNISVTQQQINDRINDEQGILKKAQQTNTKVLKQKVSNQISQQIRAIYFLQNYLVDDQDSQTIALKEQIQKQKQAKISLKKNLQSQNEEKFCKQDFDQNLYDWTLIINRKASSIQKKLLFAQFLKYGPIINLQYECIPKKKTDAQTDKKEGKQSSIGLNDYTIKILFLSIKSTWTIYNSKKQEMDLTVKGNQIQRIFQSEKLKIIQIKKQVENQKPTFTKNVETIEKRQKNEDNQATIIPFQVNEIEQIVEKQDDKEQEQNEIQNQQISQKQEKQNKKEPVENENININEIKSG